MIAMQFSELFANALGVLEKIFGGDLPTDPLPLHQAAARAIVVYIVGVAIVRIGKSRIVSRMTPIDVIIGFILGSLLSRGITGHASLSGTAAASVAIVACHWVFTALACHSHFFGTLLKGHVKLLVEDGVPNLKNMRTSHISSHDLDEAIRLRGLENIHQVRRAYKERNGEISVLTS
jgi:uncharacterized membrane protein YcaP (DUF421 family)